MSTEFQKKAQEPDNSSDASIIDKVYDKTERPSTSTGTDLDYEDTVLIVMKEAEVMADQYRESWLYTGILLFSALIIGYGYGLDANIRYVFTAMASASYGQHSLLSTIGVVNAVIGAAAQMGFARLSDVFGRLPLLIVSIVFYVIGTIIQSQAYDIQRYCAGSVFYNLGYVGVLLMVLFVLSDASTLRWRLLYQFIPTLPYIVNTWISGNVTAAVGTSNWSWGVGMWAFIFPLTSLPLIACMLHMRWLAGKTPEWKELQTRDTYYKKHGLVKTLVELFHRVDLIGILLMSVILGCILVPLTLAGGYSKKWESGKIIGPLVLGFVLIPVFILFEAKVAKYPLAPYNLVKDRGIWSAIALSFLLDFIFYMSADYLYTILIVAMDQSVTSATRISSLSSFVSTAWSPIFAVVVAYVRRMKPFIILGCSCWFLASGLLYYFRGGKGSKSGVIGALVVWGIGTTMFSYPINVSMQSATTHKHMATVTALSWTLYRIGSAVGVSVSGAIWTQLLPARLEKDMGNATMAAAIYADPYTFVAEYPWGTPEREAAVESYKYIQRMETLVALCFCTLLIFFSLCLRNPTLTDQYAHDSEIGQEDYVYTKDDDKVFDALNGVFSKFNIFSKKDKVNVSTKESS